MTKIQKLETWAVRSFCWLVIAIALLHLAGCTQVEQQLGGKMLGASVTLAGVTVALSGTIPTGAPAPTPQATPPAP